jgi:hypothetical protein
MKAQGTLTLTDPFRVSADDLARVDWALKHPSTQALLEHYMNGGDWRVSYAEVLHSDIMRTAEKAEADRRIAEHLARQRAVVSWVKLRAHVVGQTGREGLPPETTDDEILAFILARLAHNKGVSDG